MKTKREKEDSGDERESVVTLAPDRSLSARSERADVVVRVPRRADNIYTYIYTQKNVRRAIGVACAGRRHAHSPSGERQDWSAARGVIAVTRRRRVRTVTASARRPIGE